MITSTASGPRPRPAFLFAVQTVGIVLFACACGSSRGAAPSPDAPSTPDGGADAAADGGGDRSADGVSDVAGLDGPTLDAVARDADADPSPADGRSWDPSAPIVMGIAVSPDPLRPFQHAAEVSIAARGGHVVIAAINIHADGPDTLAASALLRGVVVAVSHDSGQSFGPVGNPGFVASETSDPVVRVTNSGTFWASAIGIDRANDGGVLETRGILLRSGTDGRSFAVAQDNLTARDKEWLAPTIDGGVLMAADGGFWRFRPDGSIAASWTSGPDWPVFGAYADAQGGGHFVLQYTVAFWSGAPSFITEGVVSPQNGSFDPGWSVPIGPLLGGGTWAVYGRRAFASQLNQGSDGVKLRLYPPGDNEGEELPVSASGEIAFMPAAALDSEGRLHVIYYDSAGPSGVLKYLRSHSNDVRAGFEAVRIVDPAACPGAGWYPDFGLESKDRRLREYIDLAIDGRRVHMAWTHAPSLPSRVWTSHLDF